MRRKKRILKRVPSRPKGTRVESQKQLKALKRFAVPPEKTLNPYGTYGNTRRARWRIFNKGITLKPAWRPEAMERNLTRKRLKLKDRKRAALEAHELQQMARENATMAMQTLIEISENARAPETSRIAASAQILDRGYGKASQTSITANVTSGKAAEVSGQELEHRIRSALKKVEDMTRPAGKPVSLRELHNKNKKLN